MSAEGPLTIGATERCPRCGGSGGGERWSVWVGSTVACDCPRCGGTGRVPAPTPAQLEARRKLFEGLRRNPSKLFEGLKRGPGDA